MITFCGFRIITVRFKITRPTDRYIVNMPPYEPCVSNEIPTITVTPKYFVNGFYKFNTYILFIILC
jgi:hypothetical protein